MARWQPPAATLLLSASIALTGAHAAGQPRPSSPPREPVVRAESELARAREHFQRGVEFAESGQLQEALDSFQSAYDLQPAYPILYNIGQVSRHIGDPARSLRAFERYLAEGGVKIDGDRHAEVVAAVAALRLQVATVRLQAPSGATLSVDGAPLGSAPLRDPVVLNPGTHRFRAELPDAPPIERSLHVRAAHTTDVTLERPSPRPATPPPAQPPPIERSSPLWIGWALTGTLAAAATATGIASIVTAVKLSDTPYAGPDRRPHPDASAATLGARLDTLAVTTDILLAATAASLGVTLVLSLTAPSPRAPVPPEAPRVSLGVAPGHLVLTGTF
ncbi:PEGA domain-containing protein [Chondromyces crocatus]|uniref:Uncharacterized protein n=1 Tax=Chondromyces crocatus TaxID=52 RepID=A0A0K1ELZ6_CHOCO|nr:PEGA domain-containing protein [Chondromyces crocatus]AKT41623.1 uncharacterized protein CMC5_058300 [Chondromyces crocatus]